MATCTEKTAENGIADHAESPVVQNGILCRLAKVPLVDSTCQLVQQAGERSTLLGLGVGAITKGAGIVSAGAGHVTKTFPQSAHKLDTLAHQCLDRAEKSVPALNKNINKVAQESRDNLQKGTKTTVRAAAKTFIGRQVVRGLDIAITASESLVSRLERPEVQHEEMAKEDCPDKEDGGIEEEQNDKELQSVPMKPGFVDRVYDVVRTPLHLWTLILKEIRRYMVGKRTRQKAIQDRRKLSPKKRLGGSRSAILYSVRRLLALLGVERTSRRLSLGKHLLNQCTGEHDAEACTTDKRKRADREDSDASDLDDEDLDGFDYDNYDSDDDEDYLPNQSHHSEDNSLEYKSDHEVDAEFSRDEIEALQADMKSPPVDPSGRPEGNQTDGENTHEHDHEGQ